MTPSFLRTVLMLGVLLAGAACRPPRSSVRDAPESAPEVARPAEVPRVPSVTGDRCVVKTVGDGDTLRCTDGRRVRLLGIDAPEMDQPAGPASRAALQRLAPRGQVVLLETDARPRDDFGRTLAYIWIGDTMLNEALLQAGMVVVLSYAPNVRHVARLRAAQASARASSAGLWATGGFSCLPKAHRQGRC